MLFGGYTAVWTYAIYSGNPITLGFANSPYNYVPSFIGIGGRPNLIGTPALRNDWQDLGGDRFNQGNQNPTINSLADFAYPAAYTLAMRGRTRSTRNAALAPAFPFVRRFRSRNG